MKAISIRQPWAWLIVHGWKNIENRTWFTRHRGPVLIHAAKGMTLDEYDACKIFVAGFAPHCAAQIPAFEDMERGGIVGVATILICTTHHESEWFEGPFGFVLDEQAVLPFHACRGALGIFELHRCRICGCTDDNCAHCVRLTGKLCSWVSEDLCSACAGAHRETR